MDVNEIKRRLADGVYAIDPAAVAAAMLARGAWAMLSLDYREC